MDLVDKIIAFESGTMSSEDEVVEFFQEIIDSGMVWKFHGFYGRTAMDLIGSGKCHPAGMKRFSTEGWVTCNKCGKHITEGWEQGELGQKHYCSEHF